MNRTEICARIPHAGNMCLLERVEYWDPATITCIAVSHRDAGNPLRSHGRLHAVCGVEYAAQAMAVHGSLIASAADAAPAMGLLASVRDLRLFSEHLDTVSGDLHIAAKRLSGSEDSFIYEFEISAGGPPLLRGRVAAKLVREG